MIGIYTHDLYDGRERLMPWKTVLSFAEYCSSNSIQITVFSISKSDLRNYMVGDINIIQVSYSMLESNLAQNNFSRIYFPVSKRSAHRVYRFVKSLSCEVVLYFPGSIYPLKQVVKNLYYSGINENIPYILESVFPYVFLRRLIEKKNVENCFVFSEGTFTHIEARVKLNKLKVSFTGYGTVDYDSNWEGNPNNFLISFGGPSKLRGWIFLAKAMKYVEEWSPDVRVRILLRNDKGFKSRHVTKVHEALGALDNVELITKELSRSEFMANIREAQAVILPFLLIPSELPISFHEVVSLGKKVLSIDQIALRGLFETNLLLPRYSPRAFAKLIIHQWRSKETMNSSEELHNYNWERMSIQWLEL